MTMPDKRCMVDTNVLVYSTVAGNPWHEESRRWLISMHGNDTMLCVIPQILREYLVVLTRGQVFEVKFTVEQAVEALDALLPWINVLDETEIVSKMLRELVRRYKISGKHIHDANVAAAMLSHGISRIVTYNREDFSVFPEISLEKIP